MELVLSPYGHQIIRQMESSFACGLFSEYVRPRPPSLMKLDALKAEISEERQIARLSDFPAIIEADTLIASLFRANGEEWRSQKFITRSGQVNPERGTKRFDGLDRLPDMASEWRKGSAVNLNQAVWESAWRSCKLGRLITTPRCVILLLGTK
ncbi:hypothetical protein CVT26_002661 [Gymnopilus dilepis]|uniref:Uncharacterized protein n=1 Tax=Gymnopilus dilepis TaxID=231916 RepID=A0A409VF05_9AGAR|nr:hypothetical protein CVT26_002661 [Gymnopilus dilepis]